MPKISVFNPKVAGDISCLKNLHKLETFAMTHTNISGDISVFANMPNLKAIYISGTYVKGDICSFRYNPGYFWEKARWFGVGPGRPEDGRGGGSRGPMPEGAVGPGCKSQAECDAYCDKPENRETCSKDFPSNLILNYLIRKKAIIIHFKSSLVQ